MVEMFKQVPQIDFVRYAKPAYIFSALLLALTIGSLGYRGGFNPGIDFGGGTVLLYRFTKPVVDDLQTIRRIVGELRLGQIEIKSVGPAKDNTIQFSVKKQSDSSRSPGEAIHSALEAGYVGNRHELLMETTVGPRIGGELTHKAILALSLALGALIIYLWVRFNLAFSLGAVVALVHDVTVTVGFFSVTGREVSLSFIAALLTIVGYSVNDTIVIFDRVREKLARNPHSPPPMVSAVNASINETLGRTINTSGTLLFVLIAFSFFAGEVIRDFALAMLVGCISGVYSTVFIASPVAIWWDRTHPHAPEPLSPQEIPAGSKLETAMPSEDSA